MSENVQVSVQWKNSTVYASESIECTVTFTNTSNTRSRRSPSPSPQSHGLHRGRWRDGIPSHAKNQSLTPAHGRFSSIDSTNTLRSPRAGSQESRLNGSDGPLNHPNAKEYEVQRAHGSKSHRRSISIVSIGNSDVTEASPVRPVLPRPRPGRNHVRAASMQILPRRNGLPSPGPSSGGIHDRAFTVPSPLMGSTDHLSGISNASNSPVRAKPKRFPTSSSITGNSTNQFSAYKFPSGLGVGEELARTQSIPEHNASETLRTASSPHSSNPPSFEQPSLSTKVLSPGSIGGTPRSSGEFFSMSNNSSETLASEYSVQERRQMLPQPAHRRQASSLGPLRLPKVETLMMGFAQITGTFTLDGSLINQSPFEEVKRKAIIGGQGGGGLVRSQSRKRDSGLLSSFGWGNLGETFGGLLGDTGMSSIKEAKKSVSSKAVPILSAPQSILFVDLKLAPGESKSFRFSHPIPRGSPPSHKGKAIRVQYGLIIGTQQMAAIGQQNQVQRHEVPFRVLPCINQEGDVLGHDLMSPHTLLSSSAKVSLAEEDQKSGEPPKSADDRASRSHDPDDFILYSQKLLEHSQTTESGGLLSPTEDESKSFLPFGSQQPSMRDMIDAAVRNTSSSAKRSINRFEINRSGDKIAVILLSRPAYRLGETITVIVDFARSDLACYSLHATLESSEVVDPTIALRSKSSIQRVTRRVHASHYETSISSDRISFDQMIPTNATPDFITSGVSLEWCLRFDFVTDRLLPSDEFEEDQDELMEEIMKDDRGTVQAAVQGMPCQTFDVAVPLRIYGAAATVDENAKSGKFNIRCA